MLLPYGVACNVVSLGEKKKRQQAFSSVYGADSHFCVGEGGI